MYNVRGRNARGRVAQRIKALFSKVRAHPNNPFIQYLIARNYKQMLTLGIEYAISPTKKKTMHAVLLR